MTNIGKFSAKILPYSGLLKTIVRICSHSSESDTKFTASAYSLCSLKNIAVKQISVVSPVKSTIYFSSISATIVYFTMVSLLINFVLNVRKTWNVFWIFQFLQSVHQNRIVIFVESLYIISYDFLVARCEYKPVKIDARRSEKSFLIVNLSNKNFMITTLSE